MAGNDNRSNYVPANWPQLNFIQGEGTPCSMTMQQFCNITAYDGGDCWWEDAHINWAIGAVLKLHEQNPNKVYVANVFQATKLYRLSLALSEKKREVKEIIEEFKKDQIFDFNDLKAKDIIVLPINDGYKSDGSRQTGNRSNNQQDNQQPAGSHWSLVIVDMRTRSARYADSMVKTEQSAQGTCRIAGISSSMAQTAARVLHGLDNFLNAESDQEPGQLDARTLKWIPNQVEHNKTSGDGGACGPYMFAFANNVLQNPKLIDDGLSNSFNKEGLTLEGHNNFQFDSYDTRKALREAVWNSRLIRDDNEHPESFHLNPGWEEKYPNPLGPEDVEKIGGNYTSETHAANQLHAGVNTTREDGNASNQRSSRRSNKSNQQESANNVTSEHGNTSDQRPSRSANESSSKHTGIQKYDHSRSKKWSQNLATELQDTSNPPAGPRKIPGPPPRNMECNRLDFPDGITELPRDFADENEVDDAQIKQWRKANNDLVAMTARKNVLGLWPIRAKLQVLSGIDFREETEWRLRNIWIKDINVFEKPGKRTGQMIEALYTTYGCPLKRAYFASTEDSGSNGGNLPPPATTTANATTTQTQPPAPRGTKRKRTGGEAAATSKNNNRGRSAPPTIATTTTTEAQPPAPRGAKRKRDGGDTTESSESNKEANAEAAEDSQDVPQPKKKQKRSPKPTTKKADKPDQPQQPQQPLRRSARNAKK